MPESREGGPSSPWHISIDEMEPVFHGDGTVTVKHDHFSRILKVGQTILVGSNEDRSKEAYGEIVKIEGIELTIKLQD